MKKGALQPSFLRLDKRRSLFYNIQEKKRRQGLSCLKGEGMYIAYYAVMAVIWVVIIVLCVRRLADIAHNPARYEGADAETENAAPKGRGGFHAAAFLVCAFAVGAALGGAGYGILLLFMRGRTLLFFGSFYCGVFAVFLVALVLVGIVLPLHLFPQIPLQTLRRELGASSRRDGWKRGILMFLIIFAVGFPFFALGNEAYACFDENGISRSGFFEIGETHTAYEDVEGVHIYINHNSRGEVDVFCYEVTFSDGKRVNVNYPNTGRGYFDGKILQLHRYLEERATCEAVVDVLNETDLAYLEGLPAERREIAREIFAGFDGHGKL